MANWKNLKSKEFNAGGNNFIEVSLKQPPEGDTNFIGISKGWKTEDGEKRYKSNILFPTDKLDELIKALESIKE